MSPRLPKILVVDDEEHILQLLELTLADHFEVYSAVTGRQALERAMALKPEILLLDVMLPGLSGVEVARRLRELPEFANTPVVFLTARTDMRESLAGVLAGASEVITKPFDLDELARRLKELVAQGGE